MFTKPDEILAFIDQLKARGARQVHIREADFVLDVTLPAERPSQQVTSTQRRPSSPDDDSTEKVPAKPLRAGLGYKDI
jgi:hypothetical protein